jgi:hypothetical protein
MSWFLLQRLIFFRYSSFHRLLVAVTMCKSNAKMRSFNRRVVSQNALRYMSSNSQSQQQVIVISGASSGIGEEIALKYAGKHSKLILGARRVEKLTEVAQRCVLKGASSADVIRCDVSQENDCKHLISKSIELHGRIDVLVLNAGVGQVRFSLCFSLSDDGRLFFWKR